MLNSNSNSKSKSIDFNLIFEILCSISDWLLIAFAKKVKDDGAITLMAEAEAEIDQTNAASPEMEIHITQILEKIDSFTQLVLFLLHI